MKTSAARARVIQSHANFFFFFFRYFCLRDAHFFAGNGGARALIFPSSDLPHTMLILAHVARARALGCKLVVAGYKHANRRVASPFCAHGGRLCQAMAVANAFANDQICALAAAVAMHSLALATRRATRRDRALCLPNDFWARARSARSDRTSSSPPPCALRS